MRAPLVLYAINGYSRKTTSAFSRDVFGFLRSCDEMQPRVAYQCLDLGRSASEFSPKPQRAMFPTGRWFRDFSARTVMKSATIVLCVVAAIYSGISFASGSAAKEKTINATSSRLQAVEAALDSAK